MMHNDLRCKCSEKDCDILGPKENMDKLLLALNKFDVYLADNVGKKYKVKIPVNSGYRCDKHNAKVGGVKNSQHRFGLAADIKVTGLSTESTFLQVKASGLFDGIGLYNTFIHVDKRGTGPARWDKRSKKRKELLVINLWD